LEIFGLARPPSHARARDEDIETRSDIMPVQADFDAADFAHRLAEKSDDELFETMQRFEEESENIRPDEREGSDVFAKIVLVETEIEDRFPGQLLAPYKDWQQRRTTS
jgi:hypothetical protein